MRRFNVEEFIWLLILILLTTYIGYLMLSGEVYNYLSVKTAKNLYIVIVILPILIIVQAMKVVSFNSRVDTSLKFMPIIFTLIIGVLLLLRGYMYKDSNNNLTSFNNIFAKDAIEINHETHHILEDLEGDGEEYLNKYIIFTGFVYKYEGEKFILGREEMNCCAADSYIIGVKTLAKDKFKEGQWIKVLGKISFDGEYYLEVDEYIKINPPSNIYF
ncbi:MULTISPECIES: membrane-spanning protein [unclassified Clostridium]|uniref:TIGR03943 family putative permease subunit n=1 Tax=unclassified Clostridium TaxID=2614128 RepID=UPI0029096D8D|nr:membrane-spanning protein [Clostridium sp.]MDU5105502.1 membrane-spanning protein [Clostridium sp.]